MAESNTFKVANFIGIGIDAVTYEDVFNSVDKWIANKDERSHHIACVNAFCVTLALKNKRLLPSPSIETDHVFKIIAKEFILNENSTIGCLELGDIDEYNYYELS